MKCWEPLSLLIQLEYFSKKLTKSTSTNGEKYSCKKDYLNSNQKKSYLKHTSTPKLGKGDNSLIHPCTIHDEV